MERRPGIYNSNKELPQELQRLIRMSDYPDRVTRHKLSDLVKTDSLFLDAGAGPAPGLWKYVRNKGGHYIPLDISEKALKAQQLIHGNEEEYLHIRADVTYLPFGNNTFDCTNMRFVLAHLPHDLWANAINEAYRVTAGTVLISEHDWGTLSSTTHSDFIGEVNESFSKFAEITGIDLFAGNRLVETVEELGLRFETNKTFRSTRRPGNYSGELYDIASTAMAFAEARQIDDLAKRFRTITDTVMNENIVYKPPDIVSIMVEKQVLN